MSNESASRLNGDTSQASTPADTGLQERYGACHTNYGFEPDGDLDTVDSAAIMSDEKAILKIDSCTSNVEFHRKGTRDSLSEETNLVNQSSITVSVFVNSNIKSVYLGLALADLCHKIAYLSFLASFILYQQSYLGFTPENSVILVNAFIICCMLSSAIATVFHPSWIKFLSITVMGFIIYIIGIIVVAVLSETSRFDRLSRSWSIFACILICLGAGTTRAKIFDIQQTQLSHGEMKQYRQQAKRVYWVSNIVALMALLIITALEQYKYFDAALYICVVLVSLGCMVFIIPWKRYQKSLITGTSPLKLLFNVIKEARIVKKLTVLSNLNSKSQFEDGNIKVKQPLNYLDFATIEYGGTYNKSDTEAVKTFLKVTAVLACLIPYWIIYAQFYSTYYYQGLHLNTQIGNIYIPVAWLGLVSIIVVTLLSPLLEVVIFPSLQDRGLYIPFSWRIIFGMVAALISVVAAGCIEGSGINAYELNNTITQQIGKNKYLAVDVSIFTQVPQYCLLGISDTLTGIAVLRFTQKLCKGPFRRLATSVYYSTIALGHVFALVFVSFGWFPNETYFSDDSMQKYFFILGGLQALGIFMFIIVIYQIIDLPFSRKE